jgi:hypothetical protein
VRDQISDVQSTVGALRRGTRVLVVAALLGLIAGGAYVLAQPPPLKSTTLVLLPTPALAESTNSNVETQIQIALSATVLERAGQAVVPVLPVRSVKKMIEVTAPTSQLIQIQATSTKAAEAESLSQAVADSYVGYVTNTAREVTSAALADLKVRRDDLQKQQDQLNQVIAATAKRQRAVSPNSVDGKKEAQLLAGLRTQQADLLVQLDKVEDKIATGGDAGSTAGVGTTVIQRATEAKGLSSLLRLLIWAPLGAVVFSALAAVALLVAARRDPRVRLRDDIADAVGSPVLAAVRSMPQKSVAGWASLLEAYEATPVEAWAFRQVLRGLEPADSSAKARGAGRIDHPQSVTVVSLSADGRALAVGPQLAAFASSQGIATRLITGMGEESAAALWAACKVELGGSPRPGLYLGDLPGGTKIDLTINLVVVDRGKPDLGDISPFAATILSVAAGAATEQELARVALAVDDQGRRVDGIVVADPDPTDRTSGRHTMDERILRPALPTRLTGIPSNGTVSTRNRNRS